MRPLTLKTMKSPAENKALLDEAVKRLMTLPLSQRKELFLKGLAMSMAKLKDKQSRAKGNSN